MKFLLSVLSLSVFSFTAIAFQCDDQSQLQQLDQAYENAIRIADTQVLEQILSADFIWVHNLNSMTETKTSLIERVLKVDYENPLKRQPVIEHFIFDQDTRVIMGISHIFKSRPTDANPDNIRHYQYYFSRTYRQQGSQCQLLSNMTMKIATKDGAKFK